MLRWCNFLVVWVTWLLSVVQSAAWLKNLSVIVLLFLLTVRLYTLISDAAGRLTAGSMLGRQVCA